MDKIKILFYKPIYVAMCILRLSKKLIYSFHYTTIKSKYEIKIKLRYTDTDSFIYETETEDFYKDIRKL